MTGDDRRKEMLGKGKAMLGERNAVFGERRAVLGERKAVFADKKAMLAGKEAMCAEIYQIVEQIPPGMVTTYGRIAQMAGYYGASRMVGKAMADAPPGLPCHRVVNAQGRIAPCWPEQRALLEAEGVSFKPNGCVDLAKHLW